MVGADQDSLVSVIVPCYNAETFVIGCIESIVTQSYRNLEIIIVDDGSEDATCKIVNKYIAEDARAKLVSVRHAGVSSARNAGLEIATGSYVMFVDSDDWIERHTIETLLSTIRRCNSDVVMCESSADERYGISLKNKKIAAGRPAHFYGKTIDSHTFFVESILHNRYIEQPCMYITRLSAISGIRFKEGILYEDSLFTTRLMVETKLKVTCLPDRLYHRAARPDSLTHKSLGHVNYDSYVSLYKSLKQLADRAGHCAVGVCLLRYADYFLKEAIEASGQLKLGIVVNIKLKMLIYNRGISKRRAVFLIARMIFHLCGRFVGAMLRNTA